MIAMVLSLSAVLANRFLGQLLKGEGINTDFRIEKKAEHQEQDDKENVVFSVNLHCEGCEQRVTEALSEKNGVYKVEANYKKERVEVDIIDYLEMFTGVAVTGSALAAEAAAASGTNLFERAGRYVQDNYLSDDDDNMQTGMDDEY